MKKLKLGLDDLRVDSFDTTVAGLDGRGTVHAHSHQPANSYGCAYPIGGTAEYSCAGGGNEACDLSVHTACTCDTTCQGYDHSMESYCAC